MKPRPICPECGSVDVVVGDKTGTCNRCGELFPTPAAFDYPGGPGEGSQRFSTTEPRTLTDEPPDDWMARNFARAH